MSPEVTLLTVLCGPRQRSDVDVAAEVDDLLAHELDWNHVFLLALWHKVAFLACSRLISLRRVDKALSTGGLPLLLWNHWKQLHAVNRLRNDTLLELTRQVCSSLEANSIPHVIGKGGPLLIGAAYATNERKMYDIDFLAPRERLHDIITAMEDAGFALARYSHDSGVVIPVAREELRKWLLLSRGLPNFVRKVDEPHMEIAIAQVQFKVGSTGDTGASVDAARLIEHAERVEIRAATPFQAAAPSPADLTVQLALHIARETLDPEHADWGMGWNLIKICDLQRYVDLERIDPGVVADRAVDLGFADMCHHAVAAACSLYPSPGLLELTEALAAATSKEGRVRGAVMTRDQLLQHLGNATGPRGAPASEWTKLMGTKST